MHRTYEGILVGDRIEFPSGGPTDPGPLSVRVTVVGTAGAAGNGHRERGGAMAAALEALSRGGNLSAVTDPVQWQRDMRRDRDMPGRPTPTPDTPDAP